MELAKLVAKFAEELFRENMLYNTWVRVEHEMPPDKSTPDEAKIHLEQLYQHGYQRLMATAEAIVAKNDVFCDYIFNDHFVRKFDWEDDNPYARKLFEKITGIFLPIHPKAVREVLIAYIGKEAWADFLVRLEERKKREKEEEHREFITDAENAIRKGMDIGPKKLISLCEEHGIFIRKKTKDALTASVIKINAKAIYLINRAGKLPQFHHHPSKYYQALSSIFSGENPGRYLLADNEECNPKWMPTESTGIISIPNIFDG